MNEVASVNKAVGVTKVLQLHDAGVIDSHGSTLPH